MSWCLSTKPMHEYLVLRKEWGSKCRTGQMQSNKCQIRIGSHDVLAMPLSIQPSMLLAFVTVRGHCWLMVSLLCVRTPMSSSSVLLSSLSIPIIQILCYGVCLCFWLRRPFFKQTEKLWNCMTIDRLVAYILYGTFMFLPTSLVPLDVRSTWEKGQASVKLQSFWKVTDCASFH